MKQEGKISKAVTEFIQGADKSNTKKLDKVLQKDFRNVQNGFFAEKGIFIIDKQRYIELIAEKTFGGIPRAMRIVSIDKHGNIAMVKLELESEKLLFTSFISLIQDENLEWKIIGNFPHVIMKN